MKNNNYTVFTWPYSRRYYLTHPWKWFSHLFTNIHHAWERATKGFCYSDTVEFFNWFLYVVPPALEELAATTVSYPGTPEFPDPESWTDWLRSIASRIASCREDELERRNEYYKEYMDSFNMDWHDETVDENGLHVIKMEEKPNHEDISHLYFSRERELYDESLETLKSALTDMSEHFYQIWS